MTQQQVRSRSTDGDPADSLVAPRERTSSDGAPVPVRVLASALVGLPFLVAGTALFVSGLSWESAVILLVGVLMILVGLYLGIAGSRPQPNIPPGEKVLVLRRPSIRPAFARIAMGLVFFVVAGVLFQWTQVPYVYPFVFFLPAMYLYFRGAGRYWVSRHTIYYVTGRLVAHEYRFAWLNVTQIPIRGIKAIFVSRSLVEMITGRGSVVVTSGIGERQKVKMREIDDPEPVARALQQLVAADSPR